MPETTDSTSSAEVSVTAVAPTTVGDGPVARQAHLAQQRVGHQRVRAPVRPHQHRRRPLVAEEARAHDAERERDREREQREGDRGPLHLHEQLEVQLEPGAEHEVEQAEVAQRRTARSPWWPARASAVRPQRHPGQHQARPSPAGAASRRSGAPGSAPGSGSRKASVDPLVILWTMVSSTPEE